MSLCFPLLLLCRYETRQEHFNWLRLKKKKDTCQTSFSFRPCTRHEKDQLMKILLAFLTFPCQIISFLSHFYRKRLPFCSSLKTFSRLRSDLFHIVCIKRSWGCHTYGGEKYSLGFSLLFTEMVRTLHQHLHAVDRDDAHAEQADGSQLQR